VKVLKLGPPINLAGHGMGAYAYAAQYREEVTTLTILDVPLPGIERWSALLERTRCPLAFERVDLAMTSKFAIDAV
jgi:pimeloyl-ACP methyl ester carboxylesterase